MFINACTIILTILCERIACDKEFTPNVGTVLFTVSDIKKKQWAKADIGLLRARKYFQTMLPPPVFINTFNEDYINILLGYFRDAYGDIKRAAPDAETDTILTAALSDAIGGYLKVWVLPVAKLDFYGGTVSQDNVVKLFQFHNEIKRYLDTDGKGWRQPDENVLNSITINVAPLKLAANTRSMKNPCDHLAYFEKTTSGLSIPMPTVHWNDKSSTMFVPLKNVSLIMMNSPDSSQNLMKYYVAARSCIQTSNPKEQDRFDEKFQNWLANDVVPHLKDDSLYLALGSVLTLVNKTRDLCSNVLDLYGNKFNVVNITPRIPVDLTSKKMWIISIILIIEVAWCIPALIYILRAKKAHKKDCSSNVYLYIDNNKPNKNAFFKTKTNCIQEGTCPATVTLKNCPKTCAKTGVKLFRKSQQSNMEFVAQYPSSMMTNTAATDTRSFFSSKDQSASALKVSCSPAKNSDNTLPKKSLLKKTSGHNHSSNYTNSTQLIGMSSQEPLICVAERSPTNSYTTTTTIQHCSRNASPLSIDMSNCTRSRKQKPPKRDKLEEYRVAEERIAECKKLEERKKADEYRKWEELKRVEEYERRMAEECRKFEERRKAELYRKAEDIKKSSERRRAEECRKTEDCKKLAEHRKPEVCKEPEDCRKTAEHKKAKECREMNDCGKTAEHRRTEECKKAEDCRKMVECRKAEEYRGAEDCRKTAERRRVEECREAEDCRKTAERRRAEECREAENYRKSAECRKTEEYKEAEDCRKTVERRRAEEYKKADDRRKSVECQKAEEFRKADDCRKVAERKKTEECKKAEDYRKVADRRRAEECTKAEDCRKSAERRKSGECKKKDESIKFVVPKQADECRKFKEHKTDACIEEHKKSEEYCPERKDSQIMECTIKESKYEIVETKQSEIIDTKQPSRLHICKDEQSDNEESEKYDGGNEMEELPITEGRATPCEEVCSCAPCLHRSYILSHSKLTVPENTTESITSLKHDKQVETKTTRFQVTKEFKTRPLGAKVGTGKPYLEITIDRPATEVCVDLSQCRDQPLTFKPSKIPKPTGPCNILVPATFTVGIGTKYCPQSEKHKSMIPQLKKKTVDDIAVTSRRKCAISSNNKLNETL